MILILFYCSTSFDYIGHSYYTVNEITETSQNNMKGGKDTFFIYAPGDYLNDPEKSKKAYDPPK